MNVNNQKLIFILICWIGCFLAKPLTCAAQGGAIVIATVYSPDGLTRVELAQEDKQIYYRAYKNEQLMLADSKLGISFSFANYKKLSYLSQQSREVDEIYTLPSGKKSSYNNRCSEIEVIFSASLGRSMAILFRVYNEGLAYRYAIDGTDSGSLQEELSEVAVNDFKIAWSQKYHPCYETTYNRKNWTMIQAQPEGQGSPILIETINAQYLLLTEAENTGSYATSKLMPSEAVGCYRYQPEGVVLVKCPFKSPWRVVMMGTLNDVVESTMVENLNEEADSRDWSWVKPGRASWNWGGEDAEQVISWEIAKRYVDMAHDMGWEYFQLDDGWDSTRDGWNGGEDVKRLVQYAKTQSVDILLWTHQNRFASNKTQMNNILSQWKNWGIKGVKIDFWDDDTQATMKKYDLFLEAAAEQEMLVNLHGCTRPSGTHRRWPHLLSSEAVYGGEMYLGNRVMLEASHNIMLAMTRNVIGAMDYTPGEFGTKWGAVSQYTSWAHQLALLSLYESGIQCYVDCPRNYKNNIAESYLKGIPAAWDDIKCLEAVPESCVTLARRKGDDWYVASICNQARTLSLPLHFLEEGKTYYAYIYKDGGCKAEIAFDYQPGVNKYTVLTIPLLASGGVSIRLSTSDDLPKPWQKTWEAEEARTFGKKETDAAGLCSGGKYVSALGRGNGLVFKTIETDEEGEYALTLFYMTDKDRDAYLVINNGQELIYPFPATGGLTGKHLAFTTVMVRLQSGSNTIEIKNTQALMPNIDRITVKKRIDKNNPIAGTERPRKNSPTRIWTEGHTLRLRTESNEACCTLYSIGGQMLRKWTITLGTWTETLSQGGTYLLNVITENESYTQKIRM